MPDDAYKRWRERADHAERTNPLRDLLSGRLPEPFVSSEEVAAKRAQMEAGLAERGEAAYGSLIQRYLDMKRQLAASQMAGADQAPPQAGGMPPGPPAGAPASMGATNQAPAFGFDPSAFGGGMPPGSPGGAPAPMGVTNQAPAFGFDPSAFGGGMPPGSPGGAPDMFAQARLAQLRANDGSDRDLQASMGAAQPTAGGGAQSPWGSEPLPWPLGPAVPQPPAGMQADQPPAGIQADMFAQHHRQAGRAGSSQSGSDFLFEHSDTEGFRAKIAELKRKGHNYVAGEHADHPGRITVRDLGKARKLTDMQRRASNAGLPEDTDLTPPNIFATNPETGLPHVSGKPSQSLQRFRRSRGRDPAGGTLSGLPTGDFVNSAERTKDLAAERFRIQSEYDPNTIIQSIQDEARRQYGRDLDQGELMEAMRQIYSIGGR